MMNLVKCLFLHVSANIKDNLISLYLYQKKHIIEGKDPWNANLLKKNLLIILLIQNILRK